MVSRKIELMDIYIYEAENASAKTWSLNKKRVSYILF